MPRLIGWWAGWMQVYLGHHLVFETSQVQNGIPYSDSFKASPAARVQKPRSVSAAWLQSLI
jgi:hypothetical protein